jgi:hypothetical protein
MLLQADVPVVEGCAVEEFEEAVEVVKFELKLGDMLVVFKAWDVDVVDVGLKEDELDAVLIVVVFL